MVDITDFAKRCHEMEIAELAPDIGSSGRDAWLFVITNVQPETREYMAGLGDIELHNFLFEDHSTNLFWEDYMNVFGKWEDSLLNDEEG